MLAKKQKSKQKSLTHYKAKAWDLMSEYIRRKYSDSEGYGNCYTCNAHMHWKSLQAGHCISGRHNAVLLDEEILRPQCAACNVWKHGNYEVFITKIVIENSMEWWLKKLANSKRLVKITRGDYEEIIEELKEKIELLGG